MGGLIKKHLWYNIFHNIPMTFIIYILLSSYGKVDDVIKFLFCFIYFFYNVKDGMLEDYLEEKVLEMENKINKLELENENRKG